MNINIALHLEQLYESKTNKTLKLPNPYSWSAFLGTNAKTRIYVPYSSCSQSAGAAIVLQAIEKYTIENNIDVDIVKTSCSGLCSVEPIFGIDTRGKNPIFFKNVTEYDVESILDGFFHSFIDVEKVLFQFRLSHAEKWRGVPYPEDLEFFKNQKREILLTTLQTEVLSIEEYVYYGGFLSLYIALRELTQTNLIEIVKEKGLRGRGGEGYLTGQKWQIVKETASSEKYVICNSYESDPSSYVDRFIVENMPYKVIEGIALAAYATGSSKAFIFFNRENEFAIEVFKKALEAAYFHRILGENIFNSGFSLNIQVVESPGALVSGEETALISCIEGGRATPRIRPPFPAIQGLWGKPTAVNNVETLVCSVNLILKNFTYEEKNSNPTQTKLICLSGDINNKGIAEVEFGTTFNEIIGKVGGGITKNNNFQALLLGGITGSIFSKEQLDYKLDYDYLKQLNSIVGSGGFFVLSDKVCIVDMMKYLLEIQSNESCGKCIPCREGTIQLKDVLTQITGRPIKDEEHKALERFKGVLNMENIATIMSQTSMCNFGKQAPKSLISSLKYFRNSFEEHIFERRCVANVCKKLRKYYIEAKICTGCGVCSARCPVSAIFGNPKETYSIIETKCISCGKCSESCKFNAVFYE